MRAKAVVALRHPDVLGATVAAVLAALVGALSLRVWQWRPGILLSVLGESFLVLTQLVAPSGASRVIDTPPREPLSGRAQDDPHFTLWGTR